jgi:hypothetical protein
VIGARQLAEVERRVQIDDPDGAVDTPELEASRSAVCDGAAVQDDSGLDHDVPRLQHLPRAPENAIIARESA